MTSPDPETISWVRLALACAVVFALLACLGFVLKLVKTRGIVLPGMNPGASRRLRIIETLSLDVRRRLVIVRCDGAEHLLLLGQDRDIIVETRLNENQSPSFHAKNDT